MWIGQAGYARQKLGGAASFNDQDAVCQTFSDLAGGSIEA
ncbi:hypothetical protein HMPREF9413_3518 [Paenibacillus sp. HGF7]|nr:hypothetical protein HMPREF9413_3518 [Paenibacillus sp. HGF7]